MITLRFVSIKSTIIALLLLSAAASEAAVRWSEIAARVSFADYCLRVPPGGTLIIDGDAVLGRLDVQGAVEFEDLGPRSLEVSEVRVTGEFNVGTDASAFTNDIEIRLVGASSCTAELQLLELRVPILTPWPDPGNPLPTRRVVVLLPLAAGTFPALGPDDERTILVLDDGQLRMFGSDPGITWTTLTTTAAAGGSAMTVAAGSGWSLGDRVVLAPTGFVHDEADEAGLQSGPLTLMGVEEVWDLDTALDHEHHADAADEVPVFGEVANLSRNVKIFSPSPAPVDMSGTDCSNNGYTGAHLEFNGAEIRVERPNGGNANAVLEFVEIYNAGKFDRLGHYPIHFHMIGDGSGARVHGVSVHASANRGVVVHGSTDVELTENVVYDVVGHGYYLEKAGLMPTNRNRLERNIAVQIHGCPVKDESDPDDVQYADDITTSGFFFTDPRNAFVENHAAGAFNAGFWWDGGNDFNGWNLCGGRSLHTGGLRSEPLDTTLFADTAQYVSATVYADAELATTCHGAFVGNVAHSASKGLWAEQHKDQLVRLEAFTAYKNRVRALELKNRGVTEIHDLRASDNPLTLWPATHAFNTNRRPRVLLVDSVIQGESPVRTVSYPFVDPLVPIGDPLIPFYGVEVYEGRLDVARTAFHGFDDSDPAKGKRAAFGRHQKFPFYSNNPDSAIEDLTFGPGVNALYFDAPTSDTRTDDPSTTIAGASGFQSVMLRDLSGDITGVPGQWIVPDDEFHVPLAATVSEAVYDTAANAWFIDDTVWEQGQLLVEWCAELTTAPMGGGAARCQWFNSANEAVPARRWLLINANGDDFDVVDEVRFVDLEDCDVPDCLDEVDAKHHEPQGNHNIAATNARAPGSYDVSFYDSAGVELEAGNPAFDVRAIQVHWRHAPAGSSVDVELSVPEEPSCVLLYNDRGMPAGDHEVTTQNDADEPLVAPNQWSFDGLGKVSLTLEHGADEQSILLAFDSSLTCPS